jgi:hypothetical protein
MWGDKLQNVGNLYEKCVCLLRGIIVFFFSLYIDVTTMERVWGRGFFFPPQRYIGKEGRRMWVSENRREWRRAKGNQRERGRERGREGGRKRYIKRERERERERRGGGGGGQVGGELWKECHSPACILLTSRTHTLRHTHTHTHAHARTHARARAHTHTHTHIFGEPCSTILHVSYERYLEMSHEERSTHPHTHTMTPTHTHYDTHTHTHTVCEILSNVARNSDTHPYPHPHYDTHTHTHTHTHFEGLRLHVRPLPWLHFASLT